MISLFQNISKKIILWHT